VFGLNHFTAY